MFGGDDDDAAPILAPDDTTTRARARRMLVAGQPAFHIVVVAGGEIARFRTGSRIHHVQVFLVVEAQWLRVFNAGERDLLSIGRYPIRPDLTIQARDLGDRTAVRGHRVQLGARLVVIRLETTIGGEVETRSVGRPLRLAF